MPVLMWLGAGREAVQAFPQHGHLIVLAAKKKELGGVKKKQQKSCFKEPIQQGGVPKGCDLLVNALLGTVVTFLDSQADNTFVSKAGLNP